MRYFWYALMILAIIILQIIVFCENLPKLWHNAFHHKKKVINWNPMDYVEPTEDFYHK